MHHNAEPLRLFICFCVHVCEWLNGGVTQQMDKCPFLIYRPWEREWQSLWLCQRCWTWGSSQQRGSCSRHLSRSMSASITAGTTPLFQFPTSKIHLCVFCLHSPDRDFGTDGLLQKIEHKNSQGWRLITCGVRYFFPSNLSQVLSDISNMMPIKYKYYLNHHGHTWDSQFVKPNIKMVHKHWKVTVLYLRSSKKKPYSYPTTHEKGVRSQLPFLFTNLKTPTVIVHVA